jgi:hypothetical protein
MHRNSKTVKQYAKCKKTRENSSISPQMAVKNASPKIAAKPSQPIRLETENPSSERICCDVTRHERSVTFRVLAPPQDSISTKHPKPMTPWIPIIKSHP